MSLVSCLDIQCLKSSTSVGVYLMSLCGCEMQALTINAMLFLD